MTSSHGHRFSLSIATASLLSIYVHSTCRAPVIRAALTTEPPGVWHKAFLEGTMVRRKDERRQHARCRKYPRFFAGRGASTSWRTCRNGRYTNHRCVLWSQLKRAT